MILRNRTQFTRCFGYTQLFFWIIAVVSLRVILEWLLLDFPIELNVFQDYTRFYLENVYYFLIVFIVGAVLIAKITRQSLLETARFGALFYPIILLPPLIDRLILGRTEPYSYATVANFGGNVATLSFLWGDASIGISIECLLAMMGIIGYVYRRTGNILKAVVAALLIDVFVVTLSTPDLFFGEGLGDYYYDRFLPFYYFLPFLFLCVAVAAFYHPSKVRAMLGNLRVGRSLIFATAVMAGGWIRQMSAHDLYEGYLFFNAFAVFLVWQVSVMINDIYDVEIDRLTNPQRPLVKGVLSPSYYHLAALLLSFVALSLSIVLNPAVFLLVGLSIVLAYGYSMPPLRLRRTLLGNLVIGAGLGIAFWAGLLSSARPYFLSLRHVFISILIFIIGAVLSLAKDIKDIEGDQRVGIDNFYTAYGKIKAKQITTMFIFTALNIPAVLFLSPAIFLLSLLSVFLYYKLETIQGVYMCGLLVILIVILNMYVAPRPLF